MMEIEPRTVWALLEAGFWTGWLTFTLVLYAIIATMTELKKQSLFKFLQERKLLQSYADWREQKNEGKLFKRW